MTPPEKPESGWKFFVHPAFNEKFDALVTEVERLRIADRKGYKQHPKTKLLKRIVDLIEVEIPRDPGASQYALGNTLGPEYRHWRRAKFLGRFRLFFRYSSKDRVIIDAWINDQNTLRKAGGRNDPYNIFKSLLRKGRPPRRLGCSHRGSYSREATGKKSISAVKRTVRCLKEQSDTRPAQHCRRSEFKQSLIHNPSGNLKEASYDARRSWPELTPPEPAAF